MGTSRVANEGQSVSISPICVWTLPVSASSRPCNALIERVVRLDSHGHAFKFNMLCIRASCSEIWFQA